MAVHHHPSFFPLAIYLCIRPKVVSYISVECSQQQYNSIQERKETLQSDIRNLKAYAIDLLVTQYMSLTCANDPTLSNLQRAAHRKGGLTSHAK